MPTTRIRATPTPTQKTRASALARTLDPVASEEFLAEHWERKPLVVPRGEEGRFDDLLSPQSLERVEALIAFAEARGRTILELAISWLLAHPQVASVIAGATSPEQIAANAKAATWRLTPADLAEINAIVRP